MEREKKNSTPKKNENILSEDLDGRDKKKL